MKIIYLIALLVVPVGGISRAQTNAAAVPPPRAPTIINSDRADFDLNSTPHQAFYYGHVHVDDPQMNLTSDQMIADLPEAGGHISRIVAETNVLIHFLNDKGQTNQAVSDKMVYVFNLQNGVTNETVTLTGHASVTNADGSWITGEPIIWDRAKNSMHASNETMSVKSANTGENAPSSKTNKPAATKLF